MHLSRKSARSVTISFLSCAPLLRMISALIGRDGAVTVTSRTVVWPKKDAFASKNTGGNEFFTHMGCSIEFEVLRYNLVKFHAI